MFIYEHTKSIQKCEHTKTKSGDPCVIWIIRNKAIHEKKKAFLNNISQCFIFFQINASRSG